MNTPTAMMEPAQRTGREFCLGGTFRPAHGPDGLRPQGREQAANPRRAVRRPESKFLSFNDTEYEVWSPGIHIDNVELGQTVSVYVLK